MAIVQMKGLTDNLQIDHNNRLLLLEASRCFVLTPIISKIYVNHCLEAYRRSSRRHVTGDEEKAKRIFCRLPRPRRFDYSADFYGVL